MKNNADIANISLDEDCPVGMALINYCLLTKRLDQIETLFQGKDKLSFLFNHEEIFMLDNSKIKDKFGKFQNPKIIVNDVNNLVG